METPVPTAVTTPPRLANQTLFVPATSDQALSFSKSDGYAAHTMAPKKMADAGGRRDYWHRFGQDHVDLCDVLSGYGASAKPSLAEMAALADVPVKIGGIDGSRVEAYAEAGRLSGCATI